MDINRLNLKQTRVTNQNRGKTSSIRGKPRKQQKHRTAIQANVKHRLKTFKIHKD